MRYSVDQTVDVINVGPLPANIILNKENKPILATDCITVQFSNVINLPVREKTVLHVSFSPTPERFPGKRYDIDHNIHLEVKMRILFCRDVYIINEPKMIYIYFIC